MLLSSWYISFYPHLLWLLVTYFFLGETTLVQEKTGLDRQMFLKILTNLTPPNDLFILSLQPSPQYPQTMSHCCHSLLLVKFFISILKTGKSWKLRISLKRGWSDSLTLVFSFKSLYNPLACFFLVFFGGGSGRFNDIFFFLEGYIFSTTSTLEELHS